MIDLNPDREAEESLIRAWHNDFSLLAQRIRRRKADDRELDFVARILEAGELKKRKKGTGNYETFIRHVEIHGFVVDLLRIGTKDKEAWLAAGKRFGISWQMAEKIFKRFSRENDHERHYRDDPYYTLWMGYSPYVHSVPLCRPPQEYLEVTYDEMKELDREADREAWEAEHSECDQDLAERLMEDEPHKATET